MGADGKDSEQEPVAATPSAEEVRLWSEPAVLGRMRWRYPVAAGAMALIVVMLVFWPTGPRGATVRGTSQGLDVRFLLSHGLSRADLPPGVGDSDHITVVPRARSVLRDPLMRKSLGLCEVTFDFQVSRSPGGLGPTSIMSPPPGLVEAALRDPTLRMALSGERLDLWRGYSVRRPNLVGLAAQWVLAAVALVCLAFLRGLMRDVATLRRLAAGGCARCGYLLAGERCTECGLTAPWTGAAVEVVGLQEASVERLRERVRAGRGTVG